MRAGCCRLDSRVGELKVNRIDLEGSSPHFIGCWNIEQSSLCGEVIDFFEANHQKQEQGKSAGAVDLNAKKSIDIAIHPRDLDQSEYKALKEYIDCLFFCYKDYTDQFPFLKETHWRALVS